MLARYRKTREWVWAQEESQNNGAWFFVEPRLRALDHELKYVGRDASASPATGSHQVHVREQKELAEAAIRGEAPHVVRATSYAARRAGGDGAFSRDAESSERSARKQGTEDRATKARK